MTVNIWSRILMLGGFSLFFLSCGPNTNYIRRMQALEEGVDNPTSIEELEDAIKKYQHRIEDVLNADIRIGMWYKILATRYLDNGMHAKALENFQTAIQYYPTNQNLYYYVGVCAGYMAKSALDFEATGTSSKSSNYYQLAESAYVRAIELEPRYVRALYGLSVLYVFELDRPADAIPHLQLVAEIETRNTDVRFILARAMYMTGDIEGAVAAYDSILSISRDEKTKETARQNKAEVLQRGYGSD
ncbi:MAG TPA: tetratricopeptide repeat protein [Treponemataceae bacterium]|nr:tetratricopeptide repeat protein [Treponemataceae bacterium]